MLKGGRASRISGRDGGMAIVVDVGPWEGKFNTDEEAIFRFQELLLEAAEGARTPELDGEYRELRNAFLKNPEFSDIVPRMVRIHRDLPSLWPYFKSFDPQWEPRRRHVRDEMEPLFVRAEELTGSGVKKVDQDPPWPGTPMPADSSSPPSGANPSDWTGIASPSQRLAAARQLLPIAQGSVERLIQTLSEPSHNGGPPLDERHEAIENLRKLHAALGSVLDAVEGGRWDEVNAQGLPAEAAKYAKRAARALRDDPMPYAVSAMVLGLLTVLGFPGIGAYLAGVAATVTKGRSA